MRRFIVLIATLFSAAILATGYVNAPTVTISPGYVNLPLGGSQQYVATVTGLSPQTVTWSVTAGGGAITASGLYTAPSTLPNNSVLVTATSTANPKISAAVYVNPEAAGPTLTAISPNPLPVGTDTVTFTASAATAFVKGATANCNGASASTKFISTTSISGVFYIGPGNGTATCFVNNPGTWQSNSLTVPVGATKTTPAPVISPATATLGLGATLQFSASNVTSWSALAGTITSSGLYTAPAVTTATGTDTIKATGPGGTSSATVTLATPLPVSPPTATILLGGTQQFSAPNATSWSASAGSITSTGFFTAPSTITASGTVTITATAPGGTGTAMVTLQSPSPVIQTLNPTALPLGVFTGAITGSGFTAQSTVSLGGTPIIITAQSSTTLSVSGFAPATGTLNLIVSNGSVSSAPLSVQVGNPNALVSAAAARRFLEQAAFGPTPSDAANVQSLGFPAWLNQQFSMAQISNYNAEANSSQGGLATQFVANAVTNPDQLRQKVAFALSQIFVTSINTIIWNSSMIPYEQTLMADAFTNYRQIMGDVTLSPAMGQYLNMANNAAGNPAAGTIANQNYARELMQLFTIGTTMLNPDGSSQFDANNLPLPTYGQPVIYDTARVFTGWTYQPTSGSVQWNDYINGAGPMVPYPAEHDFGSKILLSKYAEPSNLTPQDDLNNALDNVFNHPNVGPFVGKLLIQHLVKSNPTPAYIQRVSAAFADNGSGVRGDMKAVITAILLDPEARANDNGGNDQPADGHLQEPALFIAGVFRAFGGAMTNQNYFAYDLTNMNQDIYNPPSVFNYYSPFYTPPSSTLTAPEFQILTPDAAVYRANMVANLFFSYSNPVLNYGPGTTIDISPFVPLASNPATLVAALDLTLTHGVMPSQMKQAITAAVTSDTAGNLSRVETGAWLILSSSYYNVWH
jgi:uncharacterized protein (DUF1800 family)